MLKKITFAILALLMISISFDADAKKKNSGTAIITFSSTSHTFENVSQKDKMLTYDFEFVNTGNGDLIINDVVSTCGCVKGEFPKNIIAPGKKGKIKVTYLNSSTGYFKKQLTVKSNTKPSKTTLTIEGWNK